MGTILFILLIALILGGAGLLFKALWWLLIIAGALVLIGFFTGYRTNWGRN